VVRRKEVPDDIPTVALPDGVTKDGAIRVDKLLAKIGLADSVTDATRKIKAGSVEINGERVKDLAIPHAPELVIQVGKNWRKVIQ
jgi:tyrosyl-tRNA synthetase